MSKVRPDPAPMTWMIAPHSAFLSMSVTDDFWTLRILPRIGSSAWNSEFRASLAVPSALSQGAVGFLSSMPGGSFLDLCNIIFGNYFLSIGAIFICLFVGWRWGVAPALAEMNASGGRLPIGKVWGFLVRFVCPVAVAVVLIYAALHNSYM